MDQLFEVHLLNEDGILKARRIGEAYNRLLDELRQICPESREFSVAKTNLETSCFFAKKSMANVAENQKSS